MLLLLATTTYRASDFLAAARHLGVEAAVASEEASTLENVHPERLLTLDFRDPKGCARRVSEFARRRPIDAVVGVDEDTSVVAAAVARELGLPHNPVSATQAARHKGTLRALLAKAGVPSPGFELFTVDQDPERAALQVRFPCVLKPTFLAASRGVIRANDGAEFVAAWRRIERILRDPDVARRGGEAASEILVEEFVSGAEVALEGLLRNGALQVLALFDKPDALEGPYFEETIYVTPSRLPEQVQTRITQVVARGAGALGLRDGPVHVELRVGETEVWLIEIAARSIGGLCSRTLKFGTGMSLEELILRHALGMELSDLERERRAAGVMMIPIPAAGILEAVHGLAEARVVANIEDITISAHAGQELVPLPEGWRYLGFIFSRADTPERAEAALREAHGRLVFQIRPRR